jgi:hypothetical protein
VSELRRPWAGLLRRSRKLRRERPLVELKGARPVEPYEPLIRGPKSRLDARAHLRLVGFRRDEQRAESGDLARGIDCVVVRPAAWAVVLGTAELPGDCGAYGRWISSRFERDRCFVDIRNSLGCCHSGMLRPSDRLVGNLVSGVAECPPLGNGQRFSDVPPTGDQTAALSSLSFRFCTLIGSSFCACRLTTSGTRSLPMP